MNGESVKTRTVVDDPGLAAEYRMRSEYAAAARSVFVNHNALTPEERERINSAIIDTEADVSLIEDTGLLTERQRTIARQVFEVVPKENGNA